MTKHIAKFWVIYTAMTNAGVMSILLIFSDYAAFGWFATLVFCYLGAIYEKINAIPYLLVELHRRTKQ